MGLTFESNKIIFNRYEFKANSTLRKNNVIQAKEINEVILGTHPLSIVINKKEILFITEHYKEELLRFAQNNKIKSSQRYDIWKGLIEPFLENPPSQIEQNKTIETLIQNGLKQSEIQDIRERLKKVMQGWASISWSRNYLGQYDLLLNKKEIYSLHFPHNFYWWTMEIALRNL